MTFYEAPDHVEALNTVRFKETNLDLDKFQLEEICTGGAYKHSWEQLGIWLHLEINKVSQLSAL